MAAPLLAVSNLRARYGSLPVLRGLGLSVATGEVRLLIGRNGSGKSTALKAILGLIAIDGGSIRLGEEELVPLTTRARLARGVALVPQAGSGGRGVFPHLTVRENLELMGAVAGDTPDFGIAWRLFPMLEGMARRRATMLSGGQQQMLAVAMAMMVRPRVLLLDEPTCGLARGPSLELMALLRRLADEQGLAVLLVEQNVSLTLDHVDSVSALRAGAVVAEVAPDTLRDPAWFTRVL
ncbi:ABC transporter ATP-binding protein [Falsiroseomonas oryzae]|uniref:ABC transporter ATP-binding protein n=1 Tax=Falsiroseomonas oryzae TaxID=2766473 RepID=UPI0022EB0FC4|nr:ATP-binding cassette domain-containing protein [Roseomonas sp. MO-31]